MSARVVAVPLGARSVLVLAAASVAGLMMFLWPLLITPPSGQQQIDPPFIFLGILPVIVAVVLAEFSEGGMDAKVLALLGVLTAINAVLRGVSAGTGGIELVFFLLVLGGRVFGPGFGFAFGCTTLFVSALVTAGVGPWLPFQMLGAAWVGMGAGLLPRRLTGRWELAALVVYGIVASYLYGAILNLQGWPYALGIQVPGQHGDLAFVAGAPLWDNLHRFGVYTLLTSTSSVDTGRAITTTIALVVLGPAVLTTLRRTARRAHVVRGGDRSAAAEAAHRADGGGESDLPATTGQH